MNDFPHLTAPGRIGTMQLRNRMVMSPMETMYGTQQGHPSARTIAYFAERARGGVGLITIGATGIDHHHPETPGGLQIGSDDAIAAHSELTDAIHEHGAKVQPQIVHAGPDGLGPEMFGVESLGPSVIPSYLTGRPSKEASKDEIAVILDQFKAAAVRVREAGYDGMELHAAHGYMFLGSFLAPQRNRRGDRYRGTSLEGRIRVVLEAVQGIRSVVGDDFPLTLRISGYERVAAGRPIDETAKVAPMLVEAGIDAFHVSGGVIDRLVTGMVNAADRGPGLNVGLAAAVKQAVDVPVIAVGRIHDPALAEQVLADGRADFIAMARPLLADPELPRKVTEGQADRIRRCISCENCIDSLEQRFSTDCAVNPRTGREHELLMIAATKPRHVVVVGGGPAGLEAARTASLRGHRVTLLERSDVLGGGTIKGSTVHPENKPFLEWLRAEVAASSVEVRLGVDADVETVAALNPDAVVVSVGGRIVRPDVPGIQAARASRDFAEFAQEVGRRVVIIGADLVGIEVAEFFARRGHLVSLVETGETLAPEVGLKRRTEHMDRMDTLGITAHTGAVVEAVTPDGVQFTPFGGTSRLMPADDVLVTGSMDPNLELHDALVEALPGVEVHAIGDATGLGLIQKATHSAATVAYAL